MTGASMPPAQLASGTVDLSVVVPVFNESESIPLFVERVVPVLDGLDVDSYEIIFVDDGSVDGTWRVLRELAHPSVRRLRLSRNFGKEAALTAGLDGSRGQAVVVMDVDLQDPPELIPEFLRLWREGYDVVYGARADRRSDEFRKRITSGAFYRLFNALSDDPIPVDAGDFRLMDRAVVEAVRIMPERSRFMKGILAWPGFATASVPYARPPRQAGTTKFRYRRLWTFALDGLFNFSSKPLRVWTYFGLTVMTIGFLFLLLVLVLALTGQRTPSGYVSLLGVVTTLSGVQILGMGIIGEYLSRVFIEVKARPVYLLRDSDDMRHPSRMPPTPRITGDTEGSDRRQTRQRSASGPPGA
jgi:polyisoprenyl-phosphate glycosyltransferase